jgi:hypothetical protein
MKSTVFSTAISSDISLYRRNQVLHLEGACFYGVTPARTVAEKVVEML